MAPKPWSWPEGTRPTNALMSSVVALEEQLAAFQKLLGALRDRTEARYEADTAAFGLCLLCLTFAWGTPDLARSGLSTLAPAILCARGALENAARAAWLVAPDDPMDREGRWLGWYRALERYYLNLAKDHSRLIDFAEKMRAVARHYSAYRAAISEKLPDGHEIIAPPKLDLLFESLDALPLYSMSRTMSQYQHGEPLALKAALRTIDVPVDPNKTAPVFVSGARRVMLGNLATEQDWLLPISASSHALALCSQFLFGRAGATASELAEMRAFYMQARRRMDALATTPNANC